MKWKLAWISLVVFLAVGMFVYASGTKEASATSNTASLVVWMPGNDATERQTFLDLIASYEKANPSVRSEFQMIPWSDYFTKLNAAFAANAAPDLFGLGYGQAGPVQDNGKLLALNDYLKGWDGWKDIPKNILDAGSVKDTLYAVMMPDIKVFWYRTDLFKQAGLDPSHGPKTVAEVEAYAKKLTQRKDNGQLNLAGIDISTTNGEQSLAEAMLMFKDLGLWGANLEPNWDTQTGLDAIGYLSTILKAKESFFADEYNVAGGPFQNGLAAMRIDGFGARVIYARTIGADKVAFDVPPGGRAQSGATFLGVYADTVAKQPAVDLLKYFTSADGQKAIFQGAGFIPTRESVKSWFIALDPAYAKAWTAMENSRTYGPMNPHFFDVLKVIRPALESVYYGKDTAANALKKSADEYSKLLK